MNNTLGWLDSNIEKLIASLLLAAIVSLIFINVTLRYIFNSSLSWGEEATLWVFVWFVWVAISLAFKDWSHVRITLLEGFFSKKNNLIINMISSLIVLFFLVFLSMECIKLMQLPFVASQQSVVLGLPIPLLYASAPFGGLLSAYRVCQHIYKLLVELNLMNLMNSREFEK